MFDFLKAAVRIPPNGSKGRSGRCEPSTESVVLGGVDVRMSVPSRGPVSVEGRSQPHAYRQMSILLSTRSFSE